MGGASCPIHISSITKELHMTGIHLLLDDSRGVLIPEIFGKAFDENQWSVNPEDLKIIISGPDHEWYWEAWEAVLNTASYTMPNGTVWRLHQDGDLFAICPELMTAEEYENFFGEEKEAG